MGLDGKEKPEAAAEDAACQSRAAASNLLENERGKFVSHVTIQTNIILDRASDDYITYITTVRDLVGDIQGRRGHNLHRDRPEVVLRAFANFACSWLSSTQIPGTR